MGKTIGAVIGGILIGYILANIIVDKLFRVHYSTAEIHTCPPPELVKQHLDDFTPWVFQKLLWILVEHKSFPTSPAANVDLKLVFLEAYGWEGNMLACRYEALNANNERTRSLNLLVNPNYATSIEVGGGNWRRTPKWQTYMGHGANTMPRCMSNQISSCPFYLGVSK